MGIDLLELRWFGLRASTYKRDEVGRPAGPRLYGRELLRAVVKTFTPSETVRPSEDANGQATDLGVY